MPECCMYKRMLFAARAGHWETEKAEQQTQNLWVLHCTSQKTDDVKSCMISGGIPAAIYHEVMAVVDEKSTTAFLYAVLYKI